MSKSSALKLYDETGLEKLKISNTTVSQKVHHPVELDFKAPLAFSQVGGVLDFVISVRNEDATHTFSTGLLDDRLGDTEQAIADEGIAYLAHKAAIESALATEEARSIASTDVLGENLNNESIARINHAAELTSDKLNMVGDRQQAVTDYNTHVQTGIQEVDTQKASGDAAITTRLDTLMSVGEVDVTKLMQVVDAFQAADTTQLAEIAGIQSDFDALKVRIDDTITLEEAGGGGGATYNMKVFGTFYNNSVTHLFMNYENATYPDSLTMLDDLVVGDQIKIEIPSTQQEEILTFNGITDITNNYRYKVNFVEYISLSYFQANVIVTKL